MVKRFFILMVVFSTVLMLFNSKEKNDKINGVNLVSPSKKVDSIHFSKLNRINTGWVGIVPYAFSRQGEPKVIFDNSHQWWGESSAGTGEMIRLAQKNGFKVMLKPHVWMRGGWIGEFELHSENDWHQWEAEYEKYILNFATIAESLNVEMFCIGTEYKMAATQRPNYWYELIRKVRAVYSGKLTYGANWDNYENIIFWDKLDYIGIDAYFPLVDDFHPPIQSMESAWKKTALNIKDFSEKFNKPILFTEYGYQSVNGAAGEHWKVKKDTPNLNMQLQSEAYECLYKTIWKESWVAGGFLWKWHLHENRGGLQNPDWTPQGKPAEEVIARFYAK
ncbi:MAG: hypothetical protein RLO09_01825 [Cyclobacteriaceae bacterium]